MPDECEIKHHEKIGCVEIGNYQTCTECERVGCHICIVGTWHHRDSIDTYCQDCMNGILETEGLAKQTGVDLLEPGI